MKKYIPYLKKAAVLLAVLLVATTALTELIYNRRATRIGDNHAIIFFYRTNVPGGRASAWQQSLKEAHPEIEHLEVQCFDVSVQGGGMGAGWTVQSGAQSGWQIITTRMAANECDILLLDKERYEFLLAGGYLKPMEPVEALLARAKRSEGRIYGYEVQQMMFRGLEFPGSALPDNSICSTAASSQVIMCLYVRASEQGEKLAYEILSGATALPKSDDREK